MATISAVHYCDNSTLANFKAWAQEISNAFRTLGWSQTSDAGQVDWTALSSVPSDYSAYEVFVSTDALSSTCPIYVKIEYGNGSSVPDLYITVGTGGTDGNANMFPPHSTRTNGFFYVNDTSDLINCHFSGDGGNFRMAMFHAGSASYPMGYEQGVLVIGRSVDNSGVQTGDYVAVWAAHYGGPILHQVVFNPTTGGQTYAETSSFMGALPYHSNGSGSYGSSVAVSPVFPFVGALGNPRDILVGNSTDFDGSNDGATVSVNIYGAAHTYMIISRPTTTYIGQGYQALFMRYE